jgi:hypothetical protein
LISTWRRILIAGGFIIGIAIVALLAIVAYALLGEDDGEPGPQVAQRTQTATPAATPIPTPQAPTPTPAPEPTPEPTQAPPLPAPVEEQPPPVEEPPPLPPTEEPPAAPPPVEEPPLPAETPIDPMLQSCLDGSQEACVLACAGGIEQACALVQTPSTQAPGAAFAQDCQSWIDAGAPAEDFEGMAACTLLATEICTAWLSDPSVAGGADACTLVEMLSGYSSSPPAAGPLMQPESPRSADLSQCIRWLAGLSSLEITGRSACRQVASDAATKGDYDLRNCIRWLAGLSSLEVTGRSACRQVTSY